MTTTTITVPGVPVAQPRQRHAIIAGHVRNYTPTQSPANVWKALIAMKWSEAVGQMRHTGPIRLELYLRLPRPQRLNAKKFLGREIRVPHSSRPDVDNLAKACMDSLNKVAWTDDSSICQLYVEKCYAAADETPHAVIVVQDVPLMEVAEEHGT
jgi:Holliday junction resolvase RusA-like endonuclease